MRQKKSAPAIEPTDNVSSVFAARRDLLQGVKAVVTGSGFTVEEADLLVSLYGVRKLGWDDLEHDRDGFVAFNQLERYLVHNPSLLSRRIRKLVAAKPALLEVAEADLALGQHFNAKRVRITKQGVRRTEPIWNRFQKMSSILLEGIPPRLRAAHFRVNLEISARIRARRQSAKDFSVNG
ncbi:MAG TPA: hypothetical protein VGP68_06620 [Gemmataceae bacterium]|jgi:hypothetical protein|nr:hypothetical protein [Gemmataceae bacterium]